MSNVVRTAKKVVAGLGWCNFTLYDNGKVKVKSPFWEHIYFKPTHTIHGNPMPSGSPRCWLNETHLLSGPGAPLARALNSI